MRDWSLVTYPREDMRDSRSTKLAAIMAKAGHRNTATMTYLHLARTVFRDEAQRLEERLLGRGR
jgi:hypothetical protein